MDKIFNLDSPLMQVLNKITDLIWLNILTMVCCMPVITAGAALTAQHYVVLKMVRNQEGYIARSFFKSFKTNFRQATCIWLIILAFILMFAGDLYIFTYSEMEFPQILVILVCAAAIILSLVGVYIFPVLARFDNNIKNTIKNSFIIAIISLPRTIAMILVTALPVILLYVSLRLLPISALLGFSGPAYLCALLYNSVFKKFEPGDEDEAETEAESKADQKQKG